MELLYLTDEMKADLLDAQAKTNAELDVIQAVALENVQMAALKASAKIRAMLND